MNKNQVSNRLLNIPNLLSGFRLLATPFLLYLAWEGHHNMFLGLLVFSLLTDTVDGFLARKFSWTSEFGAKLDSWGDLALYMTVPFCAWWLWPGVVKREAYYVLLVIAAYSLPLVFGFAKFKRLPSYHTWAAKVSAVLMSAAVFILFIFDISWPFHFAAILQAIVAFEEISITLLLPERHCNIPSFWHSIKIRNDHVKKTDKTRS